MEHRWQPLRRVALMGRSNGERLAFHESNHSKINAEGKVSVVSEMPSRPSQIACHRSDPWSAGRAVDTLVQLMVEQRALDDWTSGAAQVLGGAIGVSLIGGVIGLVVGLLKVVAEHDSLIAPHAGTRPASGCSTELRINPKRGGLN
jgi:hypothetical protein